MTKKLDSQPHGVVVYVHFKGLERSMEVGNGTDKKIDIQLHGIAASVYFKGLNCSKEVG